MGMAVIIDRNTLQELRRYNDDRIINREQTQKQLANEFANVVVGRMQKAVTKK